MKVYLKNISKHLNEEEIKVIKLFINFLESQVSLNKDVHIFFESNRTNDMTTGVRMPHHNIHVLAKDRLLVDVMRTLSHEWVHEFQHQKMGLKDNEKIKDIGGDEENMSNVLSGIFLKQFARKYPSAVKTMYGE